MRGILVGDLVRLRTRHTRVGSVEVAERQDRILVRWYMTGATEILPAERLETVGRFEGLQ